MTAEKKAEAEQAVKKEPCVQPKYVWRNKAGSRFCEWDCVFPEGATRGDLKEAGIWWRCQQEGNSALKQGDEVRITSFNRSWVAHCHVSHASLTQVILTVVTLTELPEQREHLFQDDRYVVRFSGNGYGVYRKNDGQEMAHPVESADAARTNLLNLYPQKVA